jgi:hypothetical protein
MTTRGSFISSVALASGPAKIAWTADNAVSLCAWQLAEGSMARWNPWDTTLNWAGSGATPYNTFDGVEHVWNCPTISEGILAFLWTLDSDEPGYAGIRDELVAGDNPVAFANAVAASAWGTEPFDRIVAQVEANPALYLNQPLPNAA